MRPRRLSIILFWHQSLIRFIRFDCWALFSNFPWEPAQNGINGRQIKHSQYSLFLTNQCTIRNKADTTRRFSRDHFQYFLMVSEVILKVKWVNKMFRNVKPPLQHELKGLKRPQNYFLATEMNNECPPGCFKFPTVQRWLPPGRGHWSQTKNTEFR